MLPQLQLADAIHPLLAGLAPGDGGGGAALAPPIDVVGTWALTYSLYVLAAAYRTTLSDAS